MCPKCSQKNTMKKTENSFNVIKCICIWKPNAKKVNLEKKGKILFLYDDSWGKSWNQIMEVFSWQDVNVEFLFQFLTVYSSC